MLLLVWAVSALWGWMFLTLEAELKAALTQTNGHVYVQGAEHICVCTQNKQRYALISEWG